jgi:hypothetical protein
MRMLTALDRENERVLSAIGNGTGVMLVGGTRVVICPGVGNPVPQNRFAAEMATTAGAAVGAAVATATDARRVAAFQFRRTGGSLIGGNRGEIRGIGVNLLNFDVKRAILQAVGRISKKQVHWV